MAPKKKETTTETTEAVVPVVDGVADPAAADTIDSASGAVIEPAIVDAIEMDHPAIDDNPRARTSALQNARDMNDPLNRRPDEEGFVGEGLDASVYGVNAKAE